MRIRLLYLGAEKPLMPQVLRKIAKDEEGVFASQAVWFCASPIIAARLLQSKAITIGMVMQDPQGCHKNQVKAIRNLCQ